MIVSASRQEGVLEEQEKELLNNVFDLSDTPVRAIMTPRVEMIAIEETASLRRLMALHEEHGYSRVPIYREATDNITGIAVVGDILRHLDKLDTVTVGTIARDRVFVPENMKVIDLFQLLQAKKTHMAIVADEFGGTAGLVTFEDAIEEVFGEIYDENDEDTKQVTHLGENAYMFDATINISEAEKILGVDLGDEEAGNYETLAGFLFHMFEYIPRVGEETVHAGWSVPRRRGRRPAASSRSAPSASRAPPARPATAPRTAATSCSPATSHRADSTALRACAQALTSMPPARGGPARPRAPRAARWARPCTNRTPG
jgi:putative hemolysin